MFNVAEPRDTHGRWVAIGRGDLERLMDAAVDARAHDIAHFNGHDEGKAQQIRAHLRRQVLAKIPVAPKYHVKISGVQDNRGRGKMIIKVNAAGQDKSRVINIPHAKLAGNLEQRDVREAPAPEMVDRPENHREAIGTGTVAQQMKQAVGGTPYADDKVGDNNFWANRRKREEFRGHVQKAAHQVAEAARSGLPNAETLQAERDARRMEAAGAAKRVPAVSAAKAAALIRDEQDVQKARKIAKGAVKKALEGEFGTKPALAADEVENAMQKGAVTVSKWLPGMYGGVGQDKALGELAGRKVFIKLDSGAYDGHLRAGIPRKRPDGPPERGAAIVGNVMGIDGGIEGRMPHVVIKEDIGGRGRGMAKEFVEGDVGDGDPSGGWRRLHLWTVFDVAIGNLDRHHKNHIRSSAEPNKWFPMDQGLAFPDDDNHQVLGSAVKAEWGKELMPKEQEALQRLVDNKDKLHASLSDSGLTDNQINSFWGRVHGMLANRRLPNSEFEVADWGKPQRMLGDVAQVQAAVSRSAEPPARPMAGRVGPNRINANARNEIRARLRRAEAQKDIPAMQGARQEAVDGEARAAGAGNAAQVARWQNFLDNIDGRIRALGAEPVAPAKSSVPQGAHFADRQAMMSKGRKAEAAGNLERLDVLIIHAQSQYEAALRAGQGVRARAWDQVSAHLRERRAIVQSRKRRVA